MLGNILRWLANAIATTFLMILLSLFVMMVSSIEYSLKGFIPASIASGVLILGGLIIPPWRRGWAEKDEE